MFSCWGGSAPPDPLVLKSFAGGAPPPKTPLFCWGFRHGSDGFGSGRFGSDRVGFALFFVCLFASVPFYVRNNKHRYKLYPIFYYLLLYLGGRAEQDAFQVGLAVFILAPGKIYQGVIIK